MYIYLLKSHISSATRDSNHSYMSNTLFTFITTNNSNDKLFNYIILIIKSLLLLILIQILICFTIITYNFDKYRNLN